MRIGCLLTILVACGFSQLLLAKGPGTTGVNFLKIPQGARPAALGGAYSALADDVNTIAYNPAGLAQLTIPETSFSYNQHFESISQGWIAYAYPHPQFGTFGFGINFLSIPSFDAFDANDQPLASVSASDLSLNLAYAHEIPISRLAMNSLSLGISPKYIRERLDDTSASAYALDFGLLLKPQLQGLRIGFGVENLGSKVKFINESFTLPLTTKLGLAYQLPLNQESAHQVNISMDGKKPNDNDFALSLGTEYWFRKMIALRLGWNSLKDLGNGLSFGVGFAFEKLAPLGFLSALRMDYAFSNSGNLSNTHKISILMRFGDAR